MDLWGSFEKKRLGSQLVDKTREIARAAGYSHMAVISVIGTRKYYGPAGFEVGAPYMKLRSKTINFAKF